MYEDNDRVLNCMVQQPVDNAIDISLDNGARYTERWKGPYDAMKTVTSAGTIVMGLQFQVGAERPNIGGSGSWKSELGPPTPVGKMKWMVDAVNVTELEAGQHGLFEVTYRAVPESMLSAMGGYGWSDVSGSPSAKMVYTENSGWNLRWGTYSRNVLEYCDLSTVEDDNNENDATAHADHIIKCAQLPKPRKSQIPEKYQDPDSYPPQYLWVEPNQAGESVSADVRSLCISEKERQIYNYYVRGVQPVFHYPIITYTESWEYPLSALDAIEVPTGAGKVDKKTVAGDMAGCPFQLDKWQFLDCGTESSIRYTDTIDRSTVCVSLTHTWEGAVVIDENFYSADDSKRWFPGGGTYDDHGGETEGGEGGGEGGGGEI